MAGIHDTLAADMALTAFSAAAAAAGAADSPIDTVTVSLSAGDSSVQAILGDVVEESNILGDEQGRTLRRDATFLAAAVVGIAIGAKVIIASQDWAVERLSVANAAMVTAELVRHERLSAQSPGARQRAAGSRQ
jgi:hypothetical protein